jgi:cation diffusion facilitator CzcD-associated flavoprotein CzcO
VIPDDLKDVAARADELRAKYLYERDKRINTRPEGNAQFHDLSGVFADFDKDPYVEPGFTRPPVIEQTDVVIVGGGFGGMMTAAHLFKNDVHNYRLIEKAGDFGGTWYWNRYPGCMCDVESYCYLPLLEDTGYMPTRKYAHASEIFAYCQLLGRTFEMYPKSLFQTEVTGMVWDESANRWMVTTSRGDQLASRFVVIAGGVLHKAKLPGIPGIETFKGHAFHTSRWDYRYTGGSAEDPMVNLKDKNVAIIGTGATGVQAVPKLAESAKQLYVFQRTPSSISVRGQRPTDPEWFKEIAGKPGWQKERIENFTGMITGKNPTVDLVQDGWTKLLGVDTRRHPKDEEDALLLELIDFRNMDEIRARVDSIVTDEATAEALKPWYKQSCKRPCFHDDYLPAFNRPNVKLVNTDGKGVDRVTPNGLVVDGVEYPVDLLIFASGFEMGTEYSHRLGFDPKGTDGVPMSEAWLNGPYTLHGIHAHGFPNLLMNSATQGGQDVNFAFTLTETGRHMAYTIARCLEEGYVRVEPTIDAEEDWNNVIVATLADYGAYHANCTPGYLNNEGLTPANLVAAGRSGAYMGSALDWVKHLEAWREDGTLAGLKLER